MPGCEHFDITHFGIPGLSEPEQQRRQTHINEFKARLVVGPVTDERFWHQERGSMSIDRGPCTWTPYVSYYDVVRYTVILIDCLYRELTL